MSEIILNVLLAPLAILIYGSGLLLWPFRRWLRRKQNVQGKYVPLVFLAQLVTYVSLACTAVFVKLEHFYYWFAIFMLLNVVFTVAGMIAWGCDTAYESEKTKP